MSLKLLQQIEHPQQAMTAIDTILYRQQLTVTDHQIYKDLRKNPAHWTKNKFVVRDPVEVNRIKRWFAQTDSMK